MSGIGWLSQNLLQQNSSCFLFYEYSHDAMHNEQIDNDYHRAQTCHEQVLMPVILLQQISDGKYNIWYEQQRGDKSGNIASDRHGLSYMHNKMYAESPRQCTQRDFCRAIDSAYCCQDDEQQFFSNDDAETIGAHIPQMFKHRSSKGESAAYTICVKVHRDRYVGSLLTIQ